MFKKLFRIKGDIILKDGSKGKLSFEAGYIFDLTKSKYIKKLENEIKIKSYEQKGLVVAKIENLEVKRIGWYKNEI